MFSQFRQAVEGLALQSQDNPDVRSQSPDPLRQSPSQLAENALVNFRKSIAAQRIAGPTQQTSPRSRSASPGPSATRPTTDSGPRKTSRLEERLRASFAGSESSVGNTSRLSTNNSQAVPVTQQPTSRPISDPSASAPGTTASAVDASIARSVQVGDRGHITDPVPPQESNGLTQLPATTPHTDPLPSTVDSPDVIHTDIVVNPGVDTTTLTQEAQRVINTDPQQLPMQSSEIIDMSIIDADLSGEESAQTRPEPTATDRFKDVSVEALQERLKLVEQRFADVSTSFKKLQVERRDIDNVISELTPLNGSKDVAALREHLVNVNMKLELNQDELQRLNGKLTRQEERLEELQETHQRETAVQSGQIERLQQQLNEAEALVTASQLAASRSEPDSDNRDSIEQLRAEVTKANETAKEEEEKRVKAISLLKTVRQKLVKAEKERDDTLRELSEARERDLEGKERDRAERASLERQIDVANAEREKAIAGLRAQFDKDIAATKDRAERDFQALKQQLDAELNAQKTSYSAEISAKKLRINTLESTVANLTRENKSFFEQLELRQAELESSQCHAESLQAQNTELQFQLKELQDRIALLVDEVGELRREHEIRSHVPGVSAEEVSQLVSSVEAKYEAKLSELKRTLSTSEKERTETEATWSRKLTEKTRETEELKLSLQSSVRLRERDEDVSGTLKTEIEKLQTEARSQQGQLYELQAHIDASKDAESIIHRRLSEAAARADDSEKQLEESKSREAQLRTQNKTLRDELRKVQNSVAILERQRNPGATYWTSRSEASNSRGSISSIPDAPSSTSLPHEDINHEYLRNVILQFLEHKEMRPNLVRVLSTILHFTPQETRRLVSKV